MSTTSYPAFEADQTRLPPLVAPVPDKVTEAQPDALKDVDDASLDAAIAN